MTKKQKQKIYNLFNPNEPRQRTAKVYQEALSDRELKKMVDVILTDERLYTPTVGGEFLRQRDKALLLFSAYTGLRPMEMLRLTWSNINFEKSLIIIHPYHNKQRESEPAMLTRKAKNVLLDYKETFDKIFSLPYIFPSNHTLEPMTSNGWGKKLGQIATIAGVRKLVFTTPAGQPIYNVKPYSTRKYFGTKIVEETGSAYLAMKGLRQRKLSSTEPYIRMAKNKINEKLNWALDQSDCDGI